MPRRLPERCRPHTVFEFRAAALQRHKDADELAVVGRRTAAVYLWGYAAEMALKAGFFSAWGYEAGDVITLDDVRAAVQIAPAVGVPWSGGLHNVHAWGTLLVRCRAIFPGMSYPVPGFGGEVVARARRVSLIWRETLRYHKNVAYPHEVREAREAVGWLLARLNDL